MSGHYIEINGQPELCGDLMRWAREFSQANRQVANDRIDDEQGVSTVFLGLDHRIGPGAPLLYETMVFGGEQDQYQARYTTRAAALAGHRVIVTWLRDGGPEPTVGE